MRKSAATMPVITSRAVSRAVTTAAVLLTVVACGGPEHFTPKGEVRVPGASTPAPARTAAGDGIVFPADFSVVYQAKKISGREAARAVQEFGDFWRAWWYAIATHGADDRYRGYLARGLTATGTGVFAGTVTEWTAEKVRPTCVVRAYGMRVISAAKDRVAMVGCGDESRAGTKDTTGGQIDWSFGRQKTSRYKMRIVMTRGGSGRWLVQNYAPLPASDPAAKECQG